NGVATFSGLTLNKAAAGYLLQASSGSLTGATAGPITIAPLAASQLVVTTPPPSTVTSGAGFGLIVSAENVYGDVLTTFSSPITLTLNNAGGATLSGPASLTVNAVAGVATFTGLSINTAGTGYTISAASTGLTGATSSAITVATAAATQLVQTTPPPVSV